jgi:hypothetical protein
MSYINEYYIDHQFIYHYSLFIITYDIDIYIFITHINDDSFDSFLIGFELQ